MTSEPSRESDLPRVAPKTPIKSVFLGVALSALTLLLLLAVWRLSDQLLIVFAAVLSAVAINALIERMRTRWRIPRAVALSIFLVGAVLIGAGLATLLGTRVYSQFDELGERLPVALDALESWFTDRELVAPLGIQLQQIRENGLEAPSLAADPESSTRGILRAFQTTFGSLSAGVLWLVLTVYLILEPSLYRRGTMKLIPHRFHEQAKELLDGWQSALSWWVVGRLTSMLIVGVLTTIGLLALGVSLPLALGVLAGMLSFVPFLGPLVATVPATLIGLLDSPRTAVWVLALFGLIQVLESYVITPKIERETVSVPPALMIVGQVLGGVLLGLGGVMFATPLLVTAVVLIQVIYIKGILGTETEVWGSHGL